MLICPVCRSQNMEAAKFCGNCGHPFPRQSEPVSTLVNCAQGHIYSAVYNHCPYCPQPQAAPLAQTVKEPETSFEGPLGGPLGGSLGEVERVGSEQITQFGDEDGLIAVSGAPVDAEVVKVPVSTMPEMPPSSPGMQVEIAGPTVSRGTGSPTGNGLSGLEGNGSRPLRGLSARLAGSPSLPSERNRQTPPDPDPANYESYRTGSAGRTIPPVAPPVAPAVAPVGTVGAAGIDSARPAVGGGGPTPDRRTIVVDQAGAGRISRGKIVGWLINFTGNPDGEDYRIYSGHNRIGANPVCDIVINDDTVSGSHAILVYREGRCLIKDDLSRNGTFVNGREITEAHPLQNYDQIRLGNTYLTFVSAQRL